MSNTGKTICTPINKEAILKRFQSKSKANLNILQLIESLPDVFSREPLIPENSVPGYSVPDVQELFVTALSNARQQKIISKPKTVSKSPFANSGLVENPEAKVWYYIDEEGNSQGPFATVQMDEWYDHKYFENDLQIRRAGQDTFSKLIDALTKSDNTAARPFQKQGQFERKDYGQYNKTQFRSGNENTWDRGKNFARNTTQNENKTSSMPITRNISDTKNTSDKQITESPEQLSIVRNQSDNKTQEQKTEAPIKQDAPLNLDAPKEEVQKPAAIEKPAEVEVQPEVQPQITEPTKVENVEEAPKEEKSEEQTPTEEKKEQEQKPSLTQNHREFISDEWKVTISKNPKKKKGKRANQEEPEEPIQPIQVIQPKIEVKKEEPEVKSPIRAKEPQPVSEQPKKKILGTWGEESKNTKEPAAKEVSSPQNDFPTLGNAPTKTVKKTAPEETQKKKQPVQEAKPTQNVPQEDFPGLPASSTTNKSTKQEQPSKAKPAQTQEKPKAVIPESKPKKQALPEIQDDFPTLAATDDFPSLGKTQEKAEVKKVSKPQFKTYVEPKKPSKVVAQPKENLTENPKYLNEFPSL